MTNDLEIQEVQVALSMQPPELLDESEVQYWINFTTPVKWIDITITVGNRSTQKTLYVNSNLRSLAYTPGAETLFLGLNEPERNPQEIPHRLPTLALTPVLPGESKALQVSVPLVIRRTLPPSPSSGMQLEFEEINVSNLKRVTCRIAYSETSFHADTSEPSDQKHKRLREWGQTIEKTFERSLDQKQDSKATKQTRKASNQKRK